MQPRTDLTGNDYVSLPHIDAACGIDAVNVLHAGAGGLVEWAGNGESPLFTLDVRVDGTRVDIGSARWRRLDRWIPTFTAHLADGSEITGTVCAAAGYPAARGFLLRVELENRGRVPKSLEVTVDVCWAETRLRIDSARPYGTGNRMLLHSTGSHPDAGALVLECEPAGPALALVAGGSGHGSTAPGTAEAVITGAAGAVHGTALTGRVRQVVQVTAARRGGVTVCIGAGRERDGATAAAATMRRAGADHWIRQARLELSWILRPAQDHRWAETLNRNLLFNRFYAIGRAIDDDRIYFLRSRSPAASAPALFNEREALFWTLPALIIADPGLAREALFRTFEMFSERSGEYRRCIDGGSYDPSLALDQVPLYTWAADRYAQAAGDPDVMSDPLVQQVVHETDHAVFTRLHPEHFIAGSELLPSGDVADHPYVTMGNVMLHVFSRLVTALPRPEGDAGAPPFNLHNAADEIAAAIWQFNTGDVGGSPVVASSSDLQGGVAIYDDPALSLALLPFLGFCDADDPVWLSTMEFLRSPAYPLWKQGAVPGLTARSDATTARLSALCYDLLGSSTAGALERLQKLSLPDGVAAGGYDPATGAATDVHDAALAGLLAWTLVHAAEPADTKKQARRRRA